MPSNPKSPRPDPLDGTHQSTHSSLILNDSPLHCVGHWIEEDNPVIATDRSWSTLEVGHDERSTSCTEDIVCKAMDRLSLQVGATLLVVKGRTKVDNSCSTLPFNKPGHAVQSWVKFLQP